MPYFMGIDSSTQSMKALIIDTETDEILTSESVNFTKDLPEFGCTDGVLPNSDPLVKHSNPLMWLEAMDRLFEKMAKNGMPLHKVKAISGSGQQHGSVYLNANFAEILKNLSPEKKLTEQIESALAMKTSPIWMDSSTSAECTEITEKIGKRLQTDTGSPAIERFTGPQIRKIWKNTPGIYKKTNSIHLVSSFLASVLCGKSAPIDYGDGAGMNLLNLKTLQWDKEILNATAPNLLSKLPDATPSNTICGKISAYFAKYGFLPNTEITCWSGDNPNSLVGCGASEPGTAVISLGTSDTFFAAMENMKTDPDGYGHIFGNPAGGFMSLICFKNGSLAREKIKNECNVDWKFFDETAFETTPKTNNGKTMNPYFVPEITPKILNPEKLPRYMTDGEVCNGENWSNAEKIRAVVETQIKNMKKHSEWIGNFKKIRITGGGSASKGICQTVADAFQTDTEKISVTDSAPLGAAMRTANAIEKIPFKKLSAKFAKTATVLKSKI